MTEIAEITEITEVTEMTKNKNRNDQIGKFFSIFPLISFLKTGLWKAI
jgi:hypothetical protein